MHGPKEDDAFNEVEAHQEVEADGHTLVEIFLVKSLFMRLDEDGGCVY